MYSQKNKVCLLCSQREGGTGDGRGQLEPLDDLLPEFLVDDINKATPGHYEVEKLVEVQHLLGHDRETVDGGTQIGKRGYGTIRE